MKEGLLAGLTWMTRGLARVSEHRSGRLVFVDSDLPSASLNIIFGAPESPAETGAVTGYGLPRNLPVTWWLPADVPTPAGWWLAEYGWAVEDVAIGMALKMDAGFEIPAIGSPRPVIKLCDEPEQVRDLALVISSPYGGERMREGALIRRMVERQADYVADPANGLRAWVAYDGGVPVSSAVLCFSGPNADLSGLITRPEYSRQNQARALFLHALAEARSLGCDLVTLAADSAKIRAYAKLGFVPVNQFVLWNNRSMV